MKRFMFLMIFFVSHSVYAASLPTPLSQGLQHLAKLSGFSCNFEQTIFYDDGSKQYYQGTLAVARKGHFRWQYMTPYEQLYVSNGHGIWLYEPDLLQAQWLESLDAVDPIAMRLLEGRVKEKDVHLLDEVAGVYHVRIGDKKDAPELWLSMNAQGLPEWFESHDSLNNRNRIRLLSIKEQRPKMKQFEFEVPKGVDVIDANGMLMEKQE